MDVLQEEVVQKQHVVVDADVVMILVAVEVVKVIVILQEHHHNCLQRLLLGKTGRVGTTGMGCSRGRSN